MTWVSAGSGGCRDGLLSSRSQVRILLGAHVTNISAGVFASGKPIARDSRGEEREAAQASPSVQHAEHGDNGSLNRT